MRPTAPAEFDAFALGSSRGSAGLWDYFRAPMERTLEQYDAVITECVELFAKKAHDYGTAWRILRSNNPALAPLKAWALQIAARRGKRIATVALARRVAGILYAMWRDDLPYTQPQTSPRVAA